MPHRLSMSCQCPAVRSVLLWTLSAESVHGLGRVPGQNPYNLFSTQATGMISAAQLKGTKGPVDRPWNFQSETATPCVCVNWSQAHYLSCSWLNLPSESTPQSFVGRLGVGGVGSPCCRFITPSQSESWLVLCSYRFCFRTLEDTRRNNWR